jgi:hypothetical protein
MVMVERHTIALLPELLGQQCNYLIILYMENEQIEKPKLRQIIIETDGNSITVVKAEVAGNLEFSAILQNILNKILIK